MSLSRRLGAALAVLCCCSSAIAAAGEGAPFTWDIPKILATIEGAETVTEGIPISTRIVVSGWRADVLMPYVVKQYVKAGLWVPPPAHSPQVMKEYIVTGYDPTLKVSYSAIFQPNANGSTTVILAKALLGQRRPVGSGSQPPLFPGATGVLRTVDEGAETYSYQARGKPEEVQRFYREVLPKAGFLEDPVSPGLFKGTVRQYQVHTVARQEGGTQVVVSARSAKAEAAELPPLETAGK